MAFADKLFSPSKDFGPLRSFLAQGSDWRPRYSFNVIWGRIWSEGGANRGATFYFTRRADPPKERSDEKSHSAGEDNASDEKPTLLKTLSDNPP